MSASRRRVAWSSLVVPAVTAAAVVVLAGKGAADPPPSTLRTQTFDDYPKWDGHNNRIGAARSPVRVTQAFGYSPTSHAGGAAAGEVGGLVTPAAEPAFYAAALGGGGLSFERPLRASGKVAIPRGGGNVL